MSAGLRVLKPGGHLFLYVYPGTPRYLKLRRLFPFAYAYPPALLHGISVALAPVVGLGKWVTGGSVGALGNIALGIHDALGPRHSHEIEPEIVVRTLEACGFSQVEKRAPCAYRAVR